ncbi:protein SSX5 isoform a [Homo sapiens]|uniref:Isoform 2 of Protein SSX5 n=1 Tax=Homo sapiens TaxID=9606 RepID=O60225-2|nr:protein SSX5 isoform a [Homo sapiens]KAI2599262.1 SSX family member 5 [Homo sapiens]CAI40523.1 synovial sarcoma, X breakpoint 5 [Homo sapiens]CAI41133.1 synovial sarcoma, X breakpoint 5 [Homo sapiens]|eukprot:NP_066295.3 protein SSX5 isoform a [Homo sapiens]
MNGDDAFVRRPRVGSQIPEKMQKHPWRQVCDRGIHLVNLSPFWKVGREPASSIKALLCGRGEARAFDDIAKYFSEKEWEKMKASEKIIYVYMKRKYEAMTKLGFKATLPPFMRNKRVADFQGNDFDNDPNRGNQVEHPQMTFGRLQGIFPKITPEKPAEEGNDSKGVPEASGPQNNGKQLRPSGKLNTSEKVNKTSGPKRGKHAWTHRVRERKQLVIYEEISDPQEDDE